jgi:hypothetical protein
MPIGDRRRLGVLRALGGPRCVLGNRRVDALRFFVPLVALGRRGARLHGAPFLELVHRTSVAGRGAVQLTALGELEQPGRFREVARFRHQVLEPVSDATCIEASAEKEQTSRQIRDAVGDLRRAVELVQPPLRLRQVTCIEELLDVK